jgi:hypothetical protein
VATAPSAPKSRRTRAQNARCVGAGRGSSRPQIRQRLLHLIEQADGQRAPDRQGGNTAGISAGRRRERIGRERFRCRQLPRGRRPHAIHGRHQGIQGVFEGTRRQRWSNLGDGSQSRPSLRILQGKQRASEMRAAQGDQAAERRRVRGREGSRGQACGGMGHYGYGNPRPQLADARDYSRNLCRDAVQAVFRKIG